MAPLYNYCTLTYDDSKGQISLVNNFFNSIFIFGEGFFCTQLKGLFTDFTWGFHVFVSSSGIRFTIIVIDFFDVPGTVNFMV